MRERKNRGKKGRKIHLNNNAIHVASLKIEMAYISHKISLLETEGF
jgi:hypothetical protein